MVVKINKAKLILEEVEQFESISIEELAEGVPVSANPDPLTLITDIV